MPAKQAVAVAGLLMFRQEVGFGLGNLAVQ